MDDHYARCLSAIRLHPLEPEGYNNLGSFFYKQGLLREAIPYFKKALRLEAAFWPAHYNLANSYAKQNQMEQAAVHYQQTIDYCPEHPHAQLNAGLAYIALEEFEKALLPLEKALALNPSEVDAARHLAQVYIALGKTQEALQCLETLIKQCPNLAEAHHNLAILYLGNNNPDLAAQHFKITADLDPANETAQHMNHALNADQGPRPVQAAPIGYIEQLFDQYAPYYNQHLKETLHYQLPTQLRNALSRASQGRLKAGRVLDLGCGTGLGGIVFRDLATDLIGVDLSSKMLEQAKHLDLYETLVQNDFASYLKSVSEPFDIILAADVLVYSGNLSPFFAGIQNALRPGGWLCFSIETSSQTTPYCLNPTGRFSHSPVYIEKLATDDHLRLVAGEQIVLRSQAHCPLEGMAYIFQKNINCQK